MSEPAGDVRRGPGRLAEGAFVLVDKPRGPSSHQVSAWARDLLGVETAGHAGTLDPNVSGLLWVGVGPALKLLPLMLDFPKRYVALVTLHGPVAEKELAAALAEFTGPIYQTPPVRSAVRRARRIRTIHRLTLLDRKGTHVLLDVVGDSGTYVRTLAVDLGDALGVGAHLAELRRTGTGPFTEEGSVTLTVLADAAAAAQEGQPAPLLALLHPITEVTREFPQLRLKAGAASAVAHGAGLAKGGIRSMDRPFRRGAHVVLLGEGGELVAIGTALRDSDGLGGEGWAIEPLRVMVDPAEFPPLWKDGRKSAPTSPP
ncbi:MAG TPA: RNA-guided pseudouridylation complex pseudouridine synthase subunit Cbf5 [Thermoplasmata archaeon]|nr:RNA-guided pseudouridylation complex pseudouridine synthase subunit Cbf5 [Thermoplasmata archaeon]